MACFQDRWSSACSHYYMRDSADYNANAYGFVSPQPRVGNPGTEDGYDVGQECEEKTEC